jgi:hypothetical protein
MGSLQGSSPPWSEKGIGKGGQKSRETAKLVLYASKSLLGKGETRWNVGSIRPGCAVL